MNSLAHSTRVVSIVSKVFNPNRSSKGSASEAGWTVVLTLIFVLLLIFSAGAASAQTFFADWTTSGSSLTHNFTLPDGTTGSISRFNSICIAAGTGFMTTQNVSHVPALNYPSTFFTPTPPSPTEWLAQLIDRNGLLAGCSSPFAVVATYSLTFSEPYANPRLHFVNIDGASVHIFDPAGNPINVFALSWNNEFEIVANVVNAAPNFTLNPFCESNFGTNPNGGCGTIVVPGKHTQLILTARDLGNAAGDGDSFTLTMSVNADYGDAPASYDNGGVNEASHDLLSTNLRLGGTVDADAAEKSSFNAMGDDATGTDDENGVAAFAPYLPAGGQTCIGSFGSYVTLANEYCTVVSVTLNSGGAAQLVGWLDADGDGDFLDANNRSVPLNAPGVDDGTFATANTFLGTAQAILVWQGLPSTLPPTRYFRFRVTRDASFLVDPQPTGAVIDGEVEDYAIFEPTAANVSISGRVLTPAGSGVMNARVVLTDSQGISRVVVTNPFGHFRFDEVQAGETYVVSVFSKGYQFEPLAIAVVDDITGLDIIALK